MLGESLLHHPAYFTDGVTDSEFTIPTLTLEIRNAKTFPYVLVLKISYARLDKDIGVSNLFMTSNGFHCSCSFSLDTTLYCVESVHNQMTDLLENA